jgi:hypothetical protein
MTTILLTILNFAVIAMIWHQAKINERTRIDLETMRAELERLQGTVGLNHGANAPTA